MSTRSTHAIIGALLVGFMLAGCGEQTTHRQTFAAADESKSQLRIVDGEHYLTCGGGLAFPAPALRDGTEGLVDEAEIAPALDALRADAGIDAPRQLQEPPLAEVE
jgi:hypothetical protein